MAHKLPWNEGCFFNHRQDAKDAKQYFFVPAKASPTNSGRTRRKSKCITFVLHELKSVFLCTLGDFAVKNEYRKKLF
jgi:hypothetical protein